VGDAVAVGGAVAVAVVVEVHSFLLSLFVVMIVPLIGDESNDTMGGR